MISLDGFEWYMCWHIFGMVALGGAGWAIITGLVSESYRQEFFTAQTQWVSKVFEAPFKFFAGLVGAPARFVREYWVHTEKMKEISTNVELEKRINLLEDIIITERNS